MINLSYVLVVNHYDENENVFSLDGLFYISYYRYLLKLRFKSLKTRLLFQQLTVL